eukprot:6181525-Pyramimonas_sp.AAC.1
MRTCILGITEKSIQFTSETKMVPIMRPMYNLLQRKKYGSTCGRRSGARLRTARGSMLRC